MSAFSSADGKPLCFWRDGRLRALAARIDTALNGWSHAWGLPAAASATVCVPATAQEELSPVRSLGRHGDAAGWMLDNGPRRCGTTAPLFSEAPGAASIAAELAQACDSDFLSRLRTALALEETAPEAPPVHAYRPWSGWVLARLPREVVLLLSPQVVASVAGQPAASSPAAKGEPVVAVREALAATPCRIRVELEECEFGLGVLNQLRCGDVLRLKHRLDAPAIARHADGHALFDGYLVRRGSRRALELKPRAAAGGEQP